MSVLISQILNVSSPFSGYIFTSGAQLYNDTEQTLNYYLCDQNYNQLTPPSTLNPNDSLSVGQLSSYSMIINPSTSNFVYIFFPTT